MATPASRLLTILELLQSNQSMSGRQIADSVGVDIRSARRYIGMLEELGIPVTTERGPAGGYRLMPGYKLPPLMFNEDEALALLLGLTAARRIGLSPVHNADIDGAQAKVRRVLPEKLRRRMASAQETIVWDWPSYRTNASGVDAGIVLNLGDAIRRCECVRIEYCNSDGVVTERKLDPYGMVCRMGRWYATGYCHLRNSERLFRIDRMRSLQLTGIDFERPPDYDVLSAVVASLGSIPAKYRLEVLLDTSLEEAQSHIAAEVATMETAADGRVLLRGYVEDPNYMARLLASVGCCLEIKEPPELRVALREYARSLLQNIA
jgi:predicted DNA-binding transcriptional regulator YafY